jgi:NitT/TauT family transport system substrate-binding protein
VTWLPLLVAKDMGYFEQRGLDVAYTRVPSILNLPATLGHQFEIAPTTAPDFLNAVAGGLNIVAVAGESLETSGNKSFLLITRSDGGVKSIRDLAGRRVASPGVGSVMHIAVLYSLKKQGLDPATVAGMELPFPAMMDQLKAGHVDAVEQLEPFAGQMLQKGYVSLGDPLLEIADPVLFPFWIADGAWARAHAGALLRWVAALEDSRRFILANEATARGILAKYSGLPAQVIAGVPIPEYDFNITPAQLETWRGVLVSLGRPLQNLEVGRIVVTGR